MCQNYIEKMPSEDLNEIENDMKTRIQDIVMISNENKNNNFFNERFSKLMKLAEK